MTFLENFLVFFLFVFLCIGAGVVAYATIHGLRWLADEVTRYVTTRNWYVVWQFKRELRKNQRAWINRSHKP